MTHTTSSLLMGCGRDVEKIFGVAPNATCRVDEFGWLGLTGEAGSADMNMSAVVEGAPGGLVTEYVTEIRDRGLDAIVIVDEGAVDVAAEARALGLTEVGGVPVMMWEGGPAPVPNDRYTVRPVDEDQMEIVNSLVASAFSLDEDMVQRAFPASVLKAADIWMVSDEDTPLGCGWFVMSDDHVGVYCMATPAASQRRGVGRAVLDTAMAHYLDQGATTFTLEATEAGFHLYEQVGFTTAASPPVFVAGASTQFPG